MHFPVTFLSYRQVLISELSLSNQILLLKQFVRGKNASMTENAYLKK